VRPQSVHDHDHVHVHVEREAEASPAGHRIRPTSALRVSDHSCRGERLSRRSSTFFRCLRPVQEEAEQERKRYLTPFLLLFFTITVSDRSGSWSLLTCRRCTGGACGGRLSEAERAWTPSLRGGARPRAQARFPRRGNRRRFPLHDPPVHSVHDHVRVEREAEASPPRHGSRGGSAPPDYWTASRMEAG
jgi:hypothetical protein